MKTRPTLLLLVILFIANYTFSQTVVCENSSCTANDYTLDYFYLGDASGTPFGPGYCEPGETVNAHIWTNFVANSAANRYSLYLHFNLYVNGVFIATIDECYFEGQSIPTNVVLDVYNFNWGCGDDIVLQDFYMSWQPNSNKSCGCNGAKCFQQPAIAVQAPLIANFAFNPSCLSAYTLDFMSTTSGGAPPYSFLWNFGDGATSTLENPSHTYTSNGPYTVTLTVQDTENTDSYEFEIVNFDPNLPPEIYAPTNANIEGCSTGDIGSLPLSTTLTNITEAELNAAGGTLSLTSAITTLTYIDVVSGTCPTTVTRTFTVVDACLNTASDVQTIIINDTTLPTASNLTSINVQCTSDIPAPNIADVTDANDNCTAPTVLFISDTSDGNSCPEIITRTYSVTDGCGNGINVTQNIVVNDDIAPTASNPTALSVECFADVPVADANIITDEADNCSTPTVAFVSETNDGNTCPITITRNYSVTDDCGNSITLTHIITVNDTQAPTATAPANINVQCSSDIPAPDTNSITDEADNCSTPTVAFVSDVSNTGSCPEVITRTYSITDDCGNVTLVAHDITIIDNVSPTASIPAPINVQCIADVPAPDITIISDATDNCSAPVVSFISDISTGTCPQLITRTYQIEDGCGNTIDIIQDINVNDSTPPTASNPSPININCSDAIPIPDASIITDAADNCSAPSIAFVSDVSNGMCPEIITRTYSVTDECGNSINVTQDIISNDIVAPTLVGPLNDISADCDAVPPAPSLTFVDNCSSTVTVVFTQTDTNVSFSADYDITRTWAVTDQCGNTASFVQLVHVDVTNCDVCATGCGLFSDTTPPTASIAPDLDVDCESDIPAPDVNVITGETDNCSATVNVAFVGESISTGCFEKIERTYSVTDECGNVLLLTRRISVVDNTPPTASNPLGIDVACTDNIPAPDVNVVTDEADNCSTPIVVAFVSDASNNASCTLRITRTYSVTDGCGNTINVTQDINVIDTVPPTADTPSDINVSCISDVPIPDTNVITGVTDNCSTTTIDFISDISDGNICPETITRTYRVSDDCGNTTSIMQNIIVSDDVAPTASNPADLQFTCISDMPAPDENVVTDEADNCSIVLVSFVSENSDGLTCPETITRIYNVADVCGNSINVTQTIIIDDDIDPTASNPATIQVDESSSIPTPDITVVIDEADNCSIPTVTYISDVSDNLTCPETITRTYRVIDACNNFIDVTQNIIVNDNVSPTANTPSPLTVQCIGDVPAVDTNVITSVADNNSTPTISFVSESSNGLTCPEIITRIYRVSDDCGNSIDIPHVIVIDDDIPPTASNPADTIIDSTNPISGIDINVVIDEADNCGTPTVAFVSEISNNDTCQIILTRTYSVTDNCGNSINVFHNLIINDTTNPTASNPANILLTCNAAIPAEDTTVVTDANDNSSTPTVVYVNDVSDGLTCPETITRTYRVLDACGNYLDVIQLIIIDDIIDPTASDPIPTTVSNGNDVGVPNPIIVTDEADNCSVPTVAFVSESSDGNNCPEIITRIYSVTDACGNSINVTHIITIQDNISPLATDPAPITVDCLDSVPAPDTSLVNPVSDNNSTPTISFVSESSNNTNCGNIISRIYNVSDDCGNNIDVTHRIYVEDDIAPTIDLNLEPETTIICGEVPSAPKASITDNCTASITTSYTEDIIPIDDFSYDVVRTWTAEDVCSNYSEFTQTIHMINTIETLTHQISLCIDESQFDLMSQINDDNGTWTGDTNLLNGTILDPSITPEGDYTFTHTSTTSQCTTVNQFNINVNDDCVEYPCVRSIFDVSLSKLVTPNGDLDNETFNVAYVLNPEIDDQSTCEIIVVLKMFNRWGSKIYESKDYHNTWRGEAPAAAIGKADKLPTGTYYYVVELINSGLKPIQGFIYLGTDQ